MSPEDLGDIRRILIILSMKLRTGIDFFYSLPFLDALEITKELMEVSKEAAKRGKK